MIAKKHTGLPSLTYNDAVEEALCFGWIDSKLNPIDEDFYMQLFTPRKPKSVWSALNKSRVERLVAAGLMTAAGLALVTRAKTSGTWNATEHVEALTIPPDLAGALRASPAAARNWDSFSRSARKGFLFRLAQAKRPETRARYLQEIVELVARKVGRDELLARAGLRQGPGAKPGARKK